MKLVKATAVNGINLGFHRNLAVNRDTKVTHNESYFS